MAITTVGVYDFQPGAEPEGQRLLDEYVRFVRDRARLKFAFVGAALDTPHRYVVVTTYTDPREAKETEDAFRRQAQAGGILGRLHHLLTGPATVNRLLHD
ncbi:MAG: hypothetical protein L3K14_02935 [Thermoplasmata archaeon]|nr:hypothetical protein [Thermoplasmata archaeon]